MANLFFSKKGSNLKVKEDVQDAIVLNNILEPHFPRKNLVTRGSIHVFRFTVDSMDFVLKRLLWGALLMFIPAATISHLDKCLEVETFIQRHLGPRLAYSTIIVEKQRREQEQLDKLNSTSELLPFVGDHTNPQPFGLLTPKKIEFICLTAKEYNISCSLAVAVNMVESNGNPWIPSPVNAIGSMQVMWETAARECKAFIRSEKQLWDFEENVKCGMVVLNNRLTEHKGNVKKALMGYNGSPFCSEKCYEHQEGKRKWYSCNYPCAESKKYYESVFNAMEQVSKTIGKK